MTYDSRGGVLILGLVCATIVDFLLGRTGLIFIGAFMMAVLIGQSELGIKRSERKRWGRD